MNMHRHNKTTWGAVLGTAGVLFCGPAFAPAAAQSEDDFADLDFLAEAESADAQSLYDVADGDMEGQAVEMDSFGKIDLAVKDLEIAQVLQLLSIQSQKNIVLSRNVAGTVSADLYGVTFHEALDSILDPNGFGYEEKGNFVYVYTKDELRERELANRKSVTKVVHLNYMNGEDAKTVAESLISDNGKVNFSAEASKGDGGGNTWALGETIVVKDYEENVAEIESLLGELDVRPQQVEIEATILRASLNENNAFGVDFSVFNNLNAFDFANPLNAIDALAGGGGPDDAGGGVQSTVGNTAAGQGGVKVGYVGSDAAVFVRALDSVTDTTVVAKPSLLVLNRQEADLLVGERLGFLSTTVTETSETQTIEFLDVGTQLTVRPFISREGTVRLELKPSISDGNVTIEDGFVIPNETTQELTTNVIVEDGQTVVIGGLFQESSTVDRSQVPGLGDVPLLGAAFRGQDDFIARDEVIFLIKTTIMEPSQLAIRGEAANESIRNMRIGAREGLLPWSTDKMVSSHLIKAKQAMNDGDNEKALWHTNLALHLSPTSADALALKQKITGARIAYSNRSQLDGLVDLAIDETAGIEPVEVAEAPADVEAEAPEAEAAPEAGDAVEMAEVEIEEVAAAEPAADAASTEADWTEEAAIEIVAEEAPADIDVDVAEVAETGTDEAAEADLSELEWVFEEPVAEEAEAATEVAAEVEMPVEAEVVEVTVEAETVAIETVEVVEAAEPAAAEADVEWTFDFPEDVTEVATEEADYDTELFFDTPESDTAEGDDLDGKETAENADEDPVFNYYEQLMSEVETDSAE